jgi:hypothetical protein
LILDFGLEESGVTEAAELFMSKKDKIPRPVAGLDGIFSLKRLADS